MKYFMSLLLLGLMACQPQREESLEVATDAIYKVSMNAPSKTSIPMVAESRRLVIHTATLALQVKNIKVTYDAVKNLLPVYKAYVSTENLVDGHSAKEQSMEIRVIEENFQSLLTRLETIGEKVVSHELEARDVTEEYIDIEARMKTKKELENRYYEILKRAKTVKDMLEIETQLSNIREEIESMESRKKYFDNRVSYSTINLVFSEEVYSDNGFMHQVATAVTDGWNSILQLFLVVLSWWPWLMVGVGVVLSLIRWRKRAVTVASL